MSIRTKLIFALLLTNLMSVGFVDTVAYLKLAQKFNETLMQDAFARFREDVTAYLKTYGDWPTAKVSEPFELFVMRHELQLGRPLRHVTPGGPPPAGEPPPPGDRPEPAYRFILFDDRHRALLPTPPYREGDEVRPLDVERAQPIQVEGKTVAWASPQGAPTLSRQDRNYLAAMREALAFGVVAALTLAVLLGVILGDGLSRSIRQLTQAIKSMAPGAVRQRVVIDGRDEVGLLARAFNRMSEELAEHHERLEESNRTIREQAEQLKELSIRDGLTQLYNRRHFDEYAARLYAEAARYQRPLVVMLADIDHFKRINDRFSHAVGDDVLRQVAEILMAGMRASDVVARYGGEEFVAIFPNTPFPQAVALCDRLRRQIEGFPWQKFHPELAVTISMGVADERGQGDARAMIKLADRYLYEAKSGGRNQVRHAPYDQPA